MLGLSRPMSDFELAELDQMWPGLRDAHARHWLVVPQTTIDNIQARLPEIQTRLGGVEERAAVIESVAETLAAGDRAEWERRQGVMTEINRSLELYRHQQLSACPRRCRAGRPRVPIGVVGRRGLRSPRACAARRPA